MIDTLIFDMDGVLIDSEPVYLELIGNIYEKIGADVSREVHLSSLGIDSLTWWKKIVEDYNITDYSPEELTEMERSSIKRYFSSPLIKKHFFKGVEEVLLELKRRDKKLAVASSNERSIIAQLLKRAGIDKYFDAVVSATDSEIKNGKPFPDIFLEAARELDSDPSTCLVVEDSEMGLLAAKRAKMKTCAILSAPEPINTENADLTFNEYGEFLKKLEKYL